ncbi:MAG: hypothetical protein AAF603_11135, partial [Pseudomonadota bacterium]
MHACFIIDPLDGLNPYKDSSIDLMMEAAARGYHTDILEDLNSIAGGSDGVSAKVQTVNFVPHVREHKTLDLEHRSLSALRRHNLADYDVIFIRLDPPFDMRYFSLALLLSPLEGKTIFVNSPKGLRVISEKLSALHFAQSTPQTLVSYDKDVLRDFAQHHEKVVLKPSYFGSGQGIAISSADDPKFDEKIQTILDIDPKGPAIVQGFLPEVVDGDTRVMMLEGEVMGALGRKPPEGDFRANIAVGGNEFAVELSEAQKAAAREVGHYLKKEGIIYAGLDFIGDAL